MGSAVLPTPSLTLLLKGGGDGALGRAAFPKDETADGRSPGRVGGHDPRGRGMPQAKACVVVKEIIFRNQKE